MSYSTMLRRTVLFLACIGLLAGCGGTQTASQPAEESSLKLLGRYYGRYQASHQGQPPKDEADFRQFLASVPAEELAPFSVDDLFRSKRDGQPYVVFYGASKGPPGGPGQAPIIAYEKQGVEDKRIIASTLGTEEVDAARFKELVPNG